jgi:hypothetical protein
MHRTLYLAVTLGLAVPAFMLSRTIWPDPPGAAPPPAGLLPFLLVPALFEALGFGAGVAFLLAAGRALIGRQHADHLATAACASAGWALVSWWPHSNMHRANTTLEGLIAIDWIFHLTLIAGAAVVGLYLFRVLGSDGHRQAAGSPQPAGVADVQVKRVRP